MKIQSLRDREVACSCHHPQDVFFANLASLASLVGIYINTFLCQAKLKYVDQLRVPCAMPCEA